MMEKPDHHELEDPTLVWWGREFAELPKLAVPERVADEEGLT